MWLPTPDGGLQQVSAVAVQRVDGVKVYVAAGPPDFARKLGDAVEPALARGLFPWLDEAMRESGLDDAP